MTRANAPKTSTLLVSCPDQRGLVARLSQLLYSHGANILDADQHTDAEAGIFFQRIHFDREELNCELSQLEIALAKISLELDLTWQLSDDATVKRMALFVSRDDHCLYDLLLRHRAGEFRCEIPLILSNHAHLEPVAQQFGIPFHAFPITPETKDEQERAEFELLGGHDIDLVVLARYMQILSEDFIARFPARIINIHHSFLPAFSGGRPYHQAHVRGVKLIGATAHYATAELDEGPIIEQDVIRSSHRDPVSELTRKGRDVERLVLSRAVRWHLEDRILIYGNKTVVFA